MKISDSISQPMDSTRTNQVTGKRETASLSTSARSFQDIIERKTPQGADGIEPREGKQSQIETLLNAMQDIFSTSDAGQQSDKDNAAAYDSGSPIYILPPEGNDSPIYVLPPQGDDSPFYVLPPQGQTPSAPGSLVVLPESNESPIYILAPEQPESKPPEVDIDDNDVTS